MMSSDIMENTGTPPSCRYLL